MSPPALAWEQFRFERKLFWRNPSAAFFNFVLPLLLLVLIATVFASDEDELDVLIPGIAGMSVMATTFTALAFNLTVPARAGDPQARARHADARRLLPRRAARLGRGQRVRAGGAGGADRPPRSTASTGRTTGCCWSASRRSGWSCFGSLGIAFSHAIPNFDAAPAYVNAVFLPAIFISGVFYSADDPARGARGRSPRRCRSST